MVQADKMISYEQMEKMIQAGDLQSAETAVKKILAENPKDAETLHIYAIISFRAGKLDTALSFVENAIQVDGKNSKYRNTAGYLYRLGKNFNKSISHLLIALENQTDYIEAYNNIGIAYQESGELDKAYSSYQQALDIKSDQPDVLNNMGNLHAHKQDFTKAVEYFDRAFALAPEYAQSLVNKAEAILRRTDIDQAEKDKTYAECIQRASELAPGWLELQWKYTNLLTKNKSLDKSEEVLRRCLNTENFQKEHAGLMVNLARTLDTKYQLDEALLWARQAVLMTPNNIHALQVLAHISLRIGHPVEALEIYKKAISINPDLADLHYGMGNCFMRMEKIQDALDCYLKVHEMDKGNPRGVFAPAACLLLNGEYEKGWQAYESRYRVDGFKPNVPDITHRLWDGSPLNGRHLIVHVEQGYGDSFQFCRYINLLREREGRDSKISFLCEPETLRLMNSITGASEVHSLGEKLELKYDVQIPLLSLPNRLGTSLKNIPNATPYLKVPKDVKVELKKVKGTKIKVGIVWAGRPTHADDRYRSIGIDTFATLFDDTDVAFYALQWGERAADLKPYLKKYTNVIDHREGLNDFADTAGFIEQLDLVIAVDTSVAHLAGALGKPVWTLIPYGAEWRWLLKHERTPWYPTMRLYRQKVLSHWGPVFLRLKQHLHDVVQQKEKEAAD